MRSADEIKKGLECRVRWGNECDFNCSKCNVFVPGMNGTIMVTDALAYIQQLERERDAAEALDNNKFQYEAGFVKGFEAAQPKWISVEDKQKPRHGKEYLCVCALPNDPKHEWDWIMVLRWYSHGSNGLVDRPHFTDEGLNGMYVTHWMPLPESPKEGT